jgi:hypothetical protein
MNLNPLPNETSFNLAVPVNQFCPIPDLNKSPAEQKDNACASGIATDGFVPSTLQKGEQFLRQAFQHLRDSLYSKSDQMGKQLKRFRENFCKRCKSFRLIREGDKDVMVRINVGDPSLEPRRVLWGEERFQAVQSIQEGEGHCGGFKKTHIKVAQRYWFPSLTTFV